MSPIAIRPLELADWETFRDLRLTALKAAPGVFATSHQDAVRNTPAEWQARITGPDRQAFGMFDGARLVGITGVFVKADDPTRETALFVMSFLLPEYRGRGLSRLFYEARLAWVRAHPHLKRVETTIRSSNLASQRTCRRFGFVSAGRAPRNWPDGTTEDEIVFELRLRE